MTIRNTAGHIVLATGGLNGFDWPEVQGSISVLQLTSVLNPVYRQYRPRSRQTKDAATPMKSFFDLPIEEKN